MSTNWPGRTTSTVLLAAALCTLACGDDGPDTAETGADEGASTTAAGTAAGTAADTAAASTVAAASTAAETTAAADDGACAELPQLHVVNGTGNGVEEITMLACDMSDQAAYPVPPGGLPDGGELTISLPGPGCWILGYTGEGCFGDPRGMVEAACGETVEWELTPENHVCAGF